MLFGFRIRDFETRQRISITRAYGRWFIKFLLGGISILTIPVDPYRRAIHDKGMDSVALNYSSLAATSVGVDDMRSKYGC